MGWIVVCLLFPPIAEATSAVLWHLLRRGTPGAGSAAGRVGELLFALGLLAFWAVIPNWHPWGWWARGLALGLLALAAILHAWGAWLLWAAGHITPARAFSWVEPGIMAVLGLAALLATAYAAGVRVPATGVSLEFPLRGEWYVAHGGSTVLTNHHHVSVSQRYALDLIQLGADGRSYKGNCRDVTSYYAWDSPVYAPIGGKAIAVVEGLPDQPIGATDPANPAGNHVVLETPEGVHIWLAHLRQGSFVVKVGESIHTGQLIGRVGNSGNSTEPHLHIHAEISRDSVRVGIPILFTSLDRGPSYPRRGQLLSRR